MKHSLPTDLVNRILTYLASRPYSEVANFIKEIRDQAEPIPDEPKVEIDKCAS